MPRRLLHVRDGSTGTRVHPAVPRRVSPVKPCPMCGETEHPLPWIPFDLVVCVRRGCGFMCPPRFWNMVQRREASHG